MISNWPDPESNLQRIFVGRRKELNILSDEILRPEPKAICITGIGGIGKTSLAMIFAENSRSKFPGGVYHFNATPFEPIYETVERQIKQNPTSYLLVIDDIDKRPQPRAQHEVRELRRKHPTARVLLTSRRLLNYDGIDLNLHLEGLSQYEFINVLIRKMPAFSYPSDIANEFYHALSGHPLALEIAAGILNNEKISPREFLNRLNSFSYPGVFDPLGEEIPEQSEESKKIVSDIITVSDELLRKVHDNPKLLYGLSPRAFEELVAELLNRLGYGITPTPASKDGGKDIYAAKQDYLGTFLYIVECKKYSPENPVGVALIRQLNGVVQAEQATAGILATTSFFTKDAKEFQKQIAFQISLKDYFGIQKWLDTVVKLGAEQGAGL